MNLNKVFIGGNLTRDPEVKFTQSNMAVANFGVAVNRKWTDGAGEKKEETTFVDCEAWGKTAEAIGKFFAKGRPIFIEGRLKFDEWQDKTSGQKRSRLKVNVEGFQFIDGKRGDGAESGAKPTAKTAGAAPTVDAEDIPF